MNQRTRGIGDLTQVRILTALVEAGYEVSLPWSGGAAYDLLADDGEKILRVQCKTARAKGNSLSFHPTSIVYVGDGKYERRTYHGKVDLFGVFCPETDKVYLVPMEDIAELRNEATLTPPEGCRPAAKYEAPRKGA